MLNDSNDSLFIIQHSCLQMLFEKLGCPYCGLVATLMVDILDCFSHGLSVKINLRCSSCNEFCIKVGICSRHGKSASSRVPCETSLRGVLTFEALGVASLH